MRNPPLPPFLIQHSSAKPVSPLINMGFFFAKLMKHHEGKKAVALAIITLLYYALIADHPGILRRPHQSFG
jgi:hypothetical protein